MKIVVGSRGSKLALSQTNWVINKLKYVFQSIEFETKIIKTTGDKILDKPLDQLGDKGLFTKEIENDLLSKEIDFAVHSMKDMPSQLPEGLCFASVPQREDPRDVLILKPCYASLMELPYGATIATGSKRRKSQLLALRADLNIVPIRGNIDSRLKKIETENIDGIILAAAGLHRLNLSKNITEYLPIETVVPAPAQGALALEIRQEDRWIKDMLKTIGDPISQIQVTAERSFLDTLGVGCHAPVGAYCSINKESMKLIGLLGDNEGKIIVKKELCGPMGCEKQLGLELARIVREELGAYEG